MVDGWPEAGDYDVIPDVHADIGRLEWTLTCLGYRRAGPGWAHPDRRIAAFLGDFIDMGSANRKVLETVMAMCAAENAVAVMGNHELNALLYHRRSPIGHGDGFLRPHTPKNTSQHQTFLAEFPLGHRDTSLVLNWFMTLPLTLDLGGLRLVHACWDAIRIGIILARRPDSVLAVDDLEEIALGETQFAEAVETTLKGPEVQLPHPYSFPDIRGHQRTEVRLKWWLSDVASWRDAALSVADLDNLPDGPVAVEASFRPYGLRDKPVFFGHYKMQGRPAVEHGNALCLDYPETPCAYRWCGESTLAASHLVF